MGARPAEIDHVSVLVFRVMGAWIGLDTEQITGMTDTGRSSEDDFDLVPIHELLGLDARGLESADGTRQKVIFVKGGYLPVQLEQDDPAKNTGQHEERRIGLVINEPEEIVDIPVKSMRPLPFLVAPHGDLNGLWAVAQSQDEMIFMLDVRKLIDTKFVGVRWLDERQVIE